MIVQIVTMPATDLPVFFVKRPQGSYLRLVKVGDTTLTTEANVPPTIEAVVQHDNDEYANIDVCIWLGDWMAGVQIPVYRAPEVTVQVVTPGRD